MVMRFSCVAMMLRKHLLRGDQIQDRAGQGSVGHQARQRAFELAHVRFDRAGDVLGDVIGNHDAFGFRFFLQDGDLGFEIGGWMSAIRPHSNRERRRSSIAEISFGGQSELTMICRCRS